MHQTNIGVYLMITFKVRMEKLSSFSELLENLKTDLVAVDGCMSLQTYQGEEDQQVFFFLEHWVSKQQHQAHIENVVATGGWQVLETHLEEQPVSHYLQVL